MVWSKYKIAIVNKIFVWNILSLLSFIVLTYFQLDEQPFIGNIADNLLVNLLLIFNLLLTLGLMIFDFWVEFKKFRQNRKVYFQDMWNIVSLISDTLNLGVIT